ncbi:DUF6143 family protein [Desulfosporosinus sp. Sb-LF]|uniref:DUF6143 family protein n=1 Tax=Desulfosporosinus sp. Sb-LF TaxID=2560027 RepID=UPI00107EF7EE|nr:DUF6143 family protein [Desulfosporosinus sp. Sb-LF]TGE31767.1 hypothetical protein E4K68_15300 [Desulfosporosinus sp. Sb-LF]
MSDLLDSIILPKRLPEVVSVPNPLYKSLQGKYFVGQTEQLTFSNTTNAWGALINPNGSGVNLFANVFTITNLSDKPFLVKIWFNTNLPGTGSVSSEVSPANTALIPPPVPKVQIQFNQNVNGIPVGGVNVFDRIVPSGATLVSEEDGKFIFPQGGNWSLFLTSPGPVAVSLSAIVAFGWYEEKTKRFK